MKVTVLCSDPRHPVYPHLEKWASEHSTAHVIEIVHKKAKLTGGDLLLLISCNEIIQPADRQLFSKCLVVHASDLPRGRGWSPHIWQILGGAEEMVVTLLEAEDRVDTGKVWAKLPMTIPRYALWDEINEILFQAETALMTFALDHFSIVAPQEQATDMLPSTYRKRVPADSEVDPAASIESQFDLLRVSDPNRFPAFFTTRGHRYVIRLERIDE